MARIVVHAVCVALMIKRLSEPAPATYAELAQITGLHVKCVSDYMRALRAKKVIHVSGWLPGGAWNAPVTAGWSLGDGPDLEKPAAFTAAQLKARRKAVKKGLPVLPRRPPAVEVKKTIEEPDTPQVEEVVPAEKIVLYRHIPRISCADCNVHMRVLETRGLRRRLECPSCKRRVTHKGENIPETL